MSAHLHQQVQNLTYALRQQQQAMGALQQQVEAANAIQSADIQQPMKPRQIEDIPGLRTPKWYVVDIDFTKGDNSVRFNSAEISPDGPFIITQAAPWWLITDTDGSDFFGSPSNAPTGRVLPTTAAPFLLGSGIASVGGNSSTGVNIGIGDLFDSSNTYGSLSDIPEFSYQIEISGSGRYWTNLKIPAAAYYGWGGSPNYYGIQGFVERTDRITVHATPEVAVPHDGKVQFVFEGYQILGAINLAEELSVSG